MTRLSIILPAHQEAGHIGACLDSLLAQDLPADCAVELIVVPNGCTDATAQIAAGRVPAFRMAGWDMQVVTTEQGGKAHALNIGDAAASGDLRAYLDADILLGAGMIAGLVRALNGPGARYAGARLVVAPAKSRISRLYARFWQRLPFVANAVTGAGLFAVNAEGRSRWGSFPQLISDDGFVRLNFAPIERLRVETDYFWPITEGFGPLVRVRRRQDAGMAEIARDYPALIGNGTGDRPDRKILIKLAGKDPLGFLAYAAVSIAVRSRKPDHGWTRGR